MLGHSRKVGWQSGWAARIALVAEELAAEEPFAVEELVVVVVEGRLHGIVGLERAQHGAPSIALQRGSRS